MKCIGIGGEEPLMIDAGFCFGFGFGFGKMEKKNKKQGFDKIWQVATCTATWCVVYFFLWHGLNELLIWAL